MNPASCLPLAASASFTQPPLGNIHLGVREYLRSKIMKLPKVLINATFLCRNASNLCTTSSRPTQSCGRRIYSANHQITLKVLVLAELLINHIEKVS